MMGVFLRRRQKLKVSRGMIKSDCFDLQVKDAIAHLVMKRGDAFNTMTKVFWRDLRDLVTELDREAVARVVLLSSTGKHFSAGMDLANFSSNGAGSNSPERGRQAETSLHGVRQLQDCISSLEQARIPVIAAIQGGCIGGAVDLVTACDLRYCTDDAWFCIQETNIGIVADVGTLQRLPKLIPQGIVRELAFTGDRLPAQRALELGLVSGVFADSSAMMEHVGQVAARIAAHSPLVTAGIKSVINYSRDHSVAEGLEHVALWNTSMLSARDLGEAIQARVEKRSPEFDGLTGKRDYWADVQENKA